MLNAITAGGREAAYRRGGPQPLHDARAAGAVRADRAPVRHDVPAALRASTARTARRGRRSQRAADDYRRLLDALRDGPPRPRARARAAAHQRRARAAAARTGGGACDERARSSSRRSSTWPRRWWRCRSRKRLGLGSVLGYLIAGVAIGPFGLRLVGSEGAGRHALRRVRRGDDAVPDRPRAAAVAAVAHARRRSSASAACRCAATALVLGAGGARARARTGRPAVAVGLILAMSSTAIVLQTLTEKGLLQTEAGERSFAVLLFQDIAVIPILALLPLLATAAPRGRRRPARARRRCVAQLPGWAQALVMLGAVAAIVARRAGSWCARVFRFIAAHAAARGVHRGGAAAGRRRSRCSMQRSGCQPGARHLPRRRGAGRQRVPPRARERHRAVQGPAARAVLHRGRRGDRLRAGRARSRR